MSRRLRVSTPPPATSNTLADLWSRQITDAVNLLPGFSISSTSNGPNSLVSGDPSNLLMDVGSSVTKLWLKTSGSSNTSWQQLVVSPIAYGDLPAGSGTWQTGSSTTVTVARGLAVSGTFSIAALTGVLRADSGLVSVAAGVGAKSLFDHYADANNGTTVETDLYSDTLAAAQLGANGDKISAQYSGLFVGDATSTQRLRAYFGGTLIFDTGALGIGVATDNWDLWITIVRESSSVVRCSAAITTNFATLAASATYTRVTGLTLANTQVLKITGTAAGATGGSNQITAKESYVQWVPAA